MASAAVESSSSRIFTYRVVAVRSGAAVLTVLGLIHGREADCPVLGRTPEYVGHRGFLCPPVRNLVSRTLLHWPPHDCTI